MKVRVALIFSHRIQYFTNLLDELQRRGRVDVCAIYAHETARINDQGFGRRIRWDNRTTAVFPEIVLSRSARRPHGRFLNSFSLELFTALRDFAPDAVHLNGYSNSIQWLGWSWAVARGVPVLGRGDGDTLGQSTRSPWALQMMLARMFTRRLAHLFYQGEENRAFWLLRGARAERMSWVPCVSDGQLFRTNAFSSPAERDVFRGELGARPGDVIFVVSGKLEARKRPADAIEALARSGTDSARLWFLGSGPLEKELVVLARERGLEGRIAWLGFRNQSGMPRLLQAADVLLHPSERDPWPYSILEGAISGLALLLSDRVGSHPDWIAGAGAGRVFSCGNADQLANFLHHFATEPDELAKFKTAASRAGENYTESNFCERFEGVVKALCPANSSTTP